MLYFAFILGIVYAFVFLLAYPSIFFIVAISAGLLGFATMASAALGAAKILGLIFLALFLASMNSYWRRADLGPAAPQARKRFPLHPGKERETNSNQKPGKRQVVINSGRIY